MRRIFVWSAVGTAVALSVPVARAGGGVDPWADSVVSFTGGSGGTPGYNNPMTTLGSPERITGEVFGFPGPVTPFNPPFQSDEILSIGAGGSLTVFFDQPITDDPAHEYGVDLLIFGNSFFADATGSGVVGGIFSDGPFTVSVSADGVSYFPISGTFQDALFPTLSYSDLSGPYDPLPGDVETDFTKPVDPALQLSDLLGASFATLVSLYNGSGGGIPVDIASSGLAAVQYVRIDVPLGSSAPEFDAFAAVPEPGSGAMLILLTAAFRRKQ